MVLKAEVRIVKWFNDSCCNGIVLSTRVRLARNIKDYPFSLKMTKQQKVSMIKDVRDVFEKYGTDRYNYLDLTTKSDIEKNILVEEHLISREFAILAPSEPRMLVYDENNNISVMIGEEDHLRIQTIKPGFAIYDAYELSLSLDKMLSKGLEFAFDDKYGYLTCCPSNTGTGMRISCMLHLPLLTRNDYIRSVIEYCSRAGLTVRGFFGEGSNADGEIYQISNQITLGISEEETLKRLEEAINIIVKKEMQLREQISTSGEKITDKLWRSYGILSNARCIDSKEFLSLWSDCMLAKECGIIEALSEINLVKIMIECMPAHIISLSDSANDPNKRDIIRAERIRTFLNK